ncbi:MAG: ankyrin repeat domain-containing protein, partial [Elusimicrobiaceae bacterium]|nr:ankyrin repeat domain-containing protein [Elusimicrobiaceae bacterium]
MKLRYLFLIIIFIFAVPVLPAQDLINAVKSGKIERVKKLLPYENMEEKDENNYTAYHWTAILGLKDIAILLLENGAEPNALVTDVPSKKGRLR